MAHALRFERRTLGLEPSRLPLPQAYIFSCLYPLSIGTVYRGTRTCFRSTNFGSLAPRMQTCPRVSQRTGFFIPLLHTGGYLSTLRREHLDHIRACLHTALDLASAHVFSIERLEHVRARVYHSVELPIRTRN